MSNLKHLDLRELYKALEECDQTLDHLKKRLSGQTTRRQWITYYIEKRSAEKLKDATKTGSENELRSYR